MRKWMLIGAMLAVAGCGSDDPEDTGAADVVGSEEVQTGDDGAGASGDSTTSDDGDSTGDDAGTDDGDTGSATTGDDTSGTTGGEGTTGGDGTGGESTGGTTGPVTPGACESDADTIATVDVFAVIGTCAAQCLGQTPECAQQCTQAEAGVSIGCSTCLGAVVDCSVNVCGGQCLAGGAECVSCVQGSCGPDFETCAGVSIPDPPPCTPSCDGKSCGPDGCGGSCGPCDGGLCEAGECQAVTDGCANGDDEAVIEATDPSAEAGTCGINCLSEPDVQACAVQCIQDATGLSKSCSFCFGDHTGCTAQACLFDCFDPTSAGCQQCQEANCNPGFETCSGVDFPGTAGFSGACETPEDNASLAGVDTQVVLASCAEVCAGDADVTTCAQGCVAGELSLTDDCAGCYSGAVECMSSTCADPCGADASSPACASCAAEACAFGFDLCSGKSLAVEFPCTPQCAEGACGGDGCGGTCGSCGGGELCVEGSCAPLANSWCSGDADQNTLATADPGASVQGCGSACFASPALGECLGGCVAADIGLSEPCALCFGLDAQCTLDSCAEACAASTTSAECVVCREGACAQSFEGCSGLVFSDYVTVE